MAIVERIVYNEEQELIDEGTLSKNKTKNYVDNKKLYESFIEYHKEKVWCEYLEEPPPKLPNYIGMAIIKICTRCCNHRFYVRYSNNWKEEMIGHAIVTCTANAPKFNPMKYTNPFSYITMIAYNAIKEMLNKEHKQDYIKNKLYDLNKGFLSTDEEPDTALLTTEDDDIYKDRLERISKFEESQAKKRKKASATKESNKPPEASLDDYFA